MDTTRERNSLLRGNAARKRGETEGARSCTEELSARNRGIPHETDGHERRWTDAPTEQHKSGRRQEERQKATTKRSGRSDSEGSIPRKARKLAIGVTMSRPSARRQINHTGAFYSRRLCWNNTLPYRELRHSYSFCRTTAPPSSEAMHASVFGACVLACVRTQSAGATPNGKKRPCLRAGSGNCKSSPFWSNWP